MNERAYLYCQVVSSKKDEVLIKSELLDETQFELEVSKHSIMHIDNSSPPACWLEITYSGERDEVATISLPRPIIDKGHRITVATNRIQRILPETTRRDKIKLTKGVEGNNAYIHQAGEILEYDRIIPDRGYWIITGHGEGFAVPLDCANIQN